MQRKLPSQKCERVCNLDGTDLRRKCLRWVLDHRDAIANAHPDIPPSLNYRAADIWEPFFVLADLAGGDWPEKARHAALALAECAQESNFISSLLLDTLVIFVDNQADRLFSRDLVAALNSWLDRRWREVTNGKPITELWLAKQLRPFGIQPKTIWIGEVSAKGYLLDEIQTASQRYVTRADYEALKAEFQSPKPPADASPSPQPPPPDPSQQPQPPPTPPPAS